MTCTPAAGNTYYLVVPRNAGTEGSYGTTSAGAERPAGANACAPRKFAGCSLLCSGGQNPGASCTTSQDCTGGCKGSTGQGCTSDTQCPGCSERPQSPLHRRQPMPRLRRRPACTALADCQAVGGPASSSRAADGTCTSPVPRHACCRSVRVQSES
jgi:hypothetical protein